MESVQSLSEVCAINWPVHLPWRVCESLIFMSRFYRNIVSRTNFVLISYTMRPAMLLFAVT